MMWGPDRVHRNWVVDGYGWVVYRGSGVTYEPAATVVLFCE